MSVPAQPSPTYLVNRLRTLALTSPPQTALFYARIWHALAQAGSLGIDDPHSSLSTSREDAHESVHVLALAFLANDEPYSALHLVRDTAEQYGPASAAATSSRHAARSRPPVGCLGCATLVARLCEAVGRYSEGMQVLERAMRQHPEADAKLPHMQPTLAHATHLLFARMSQRSKETDIAAEQYMKALSDNVWLWEAYTSLCDLGAAPIPDHTFPPPQTAARTSSTATLRASSQNTAPTRPGHVPAGTAAPREMNPFGASGPSKATRPDGARSPPAPPIAGARYARPAQNGLMGAMTPGAGYEDSILGSNGAGAGMGPGAGGLFTPAVGAGNGYGAPGGHAAGGTGASRVQMLGGTLWDTPSSVGDTTFPSVQPMRRVLPSRTATAPATAVSTPAMSSGHAAGPPAMKRARGPNPAGSSTLPARHDFETPVGTNGTSSSHAHPHAPGRFVNQAGYPAHSAADADMHAKRSQRDPRSAEPAGEENLPPRRSTRLKVPPIAKPSLRLTKASDRATRTTVGGIKRESRSPSATAGSSVSGRSDIMSPPTDSAYLSPGEGPSTAATSTIDTPTEAALQYSADLYLLSIVRAFALSYRALSIYDTIAAITHLDALPPALQSSPLSLAILSIAFYEQANYVRARRAFESLFQLEPYRLHGVHLYSTLLWHLADVPALSALAQGVMAIDKTRPEVWIAVGNCLSLGGDHEGALRCFRRAAAVGTDVSSGAGAGGKGGVIGEAVFGGGTRAVAYAYTLAGYEAVELEEYERAVRMYRLAIRTDGRSYNAWYGLGQAFVKMSKLKYAEHHFRRAVEINPSNPVLLCCIGQVLEAQQDNRAALSIYTRAALLPSSSSTSSPIPLPLVQFKRIRMLIALAQLPEALALLEPLAKELPDEAQVQLLLGKCLLAVGRRTDGVQALVEARELAPRLGAKIGRLIGGEEESEDEED